MIRTVTNMKYDEMISAVYAEMESRKSPSMMNTKTVPDNLLPTVY